MHTPTYDMTSAPEIIIKPRFSETDAMTHIGNTAVPVWFEEAREPITRKLHPSLAIDDWPFIVAHVDIDYHHQIYVDSLVSIKVGISNIGGKSFTMYHEASQNGQRVASGHAVIVYFDYSTKQTVPLPDALRDTLNEYFITAKATH